MCRSIKVLRAAGGALASPAEVEAAALQFVRKISGIHRPTAVTGPAFEQAVREIALAGQRLLSELPPHRSVPVRTKASGPIELTAPPPSEAAG